MASPQSYNYSMVIGDTIPDVVFRFNRGGVGFVWNLTLTPPSQPNIILSTEDNTLSASLEFVDGLPYTTVTWTVLPEQSQAIQTGSLTRYHYSSIDPDGGVQTLLKGVIAGEAR
ncbi:hypothetical protein [Roseixanthobacter pseudopolyaromaticivorans]|uniref:hypothetical protein n=1 Tax=Xanthobacteraceae TaxID=335928 RepID=UPI0037282E54